MHLGDSCREIFVSSAMTHQLRIVAPELLLSQDPGRSVVKLAYSYAC